MADANAVLDRSIDESLSDCCDDLECTLLLLLLLLLLIVADAAAACVAVAVVIDIVVVVPAVRLSNLPFFR
jgi:hypothetical protein